MRKLTFLEKVLFVAVVCLVVSTAFLAYAAQQLLSNSVIGEVKESGLHLGLDPSVIYLGESFNLTATLTPHVQGKTVTFREWNYNETIGSVQTDALGIASIIFSPSLVGMYNFTATCQYP